MMSEVGFEPTPSVEDQKASCSIIENQGIKP